MKENIEHRIDFGITISEGLYAEGLLDVVNFLYDELKEFLEQEGRFFGIVKSYTKSIDLAFSKINSQVKDEEIINTYGRILYLFKPLLRKEFKRLRGKRLTPGDVVIVMIHKILDIISGVQGFSYTKELKTIQKVIGKFFDNIRNSRKNDSLYYLSNTIRTCMESGLIGKYTLDTLTLNEPDVPKEKLPEPVMQINEEENVLSEISLIPGSEESGKEE